jgi:hypothetical protein
MQGAGTPGNHKLSAGSTAYFDFDDEGLSDDWLDFSVETSDEVYEAIKSHSVKNNYNR